MRERGNPLLKKMDFYLGVPLVFLLSLFRRKAKSVPTKINTIGVLKSSAIGDTVLISAIIEDLRRHFPQARVILYAGASNAKAAELLVGKEAVVTLPMLNPLRAIQKVREEELDVFIDADSWPRINSLIAMGAKAKIKIGFKTPGQLRHFAYDLAIEHSHEKHELDNYRELIRALGVSKFEEPKISGFGPKLGSRRVLLHPWPGGTRAVEKMWPNSSWLALAQGLASEGFRIGVSTGPADLMKSQELAKAAPQLLEVVSPKSLVQLLETLGESDLVVTVDTGVAHLAGAMGQKTLVLHGPTSPSRWGARGLAVRTLKDDQPAIIHLGFEIPEGNGVMLASEKVLEAALAMLTAEKQNR